MPTTQPQRPQPRASRRVAFVCTALAVLLAACDKPIKSCCADEPEAPTRDAAPGEATPLAANSIYHADGTWQDSSGAKVPLTALRGKVTVAAMIFTHCAYACPRIVADLTALAAKLPADAPVRFALFSMDPDRDTPQRLADFAREHQLDGRFVLFTAPDAQVRELAALLGMRYKRQASGEFSHSNGFVVIDADGVVASRSDGLGADLEPARAAIARLQR